MNYPNPRGEYEQPLAWTDPCDGEHLWRAVVLDGRPIGVTCEGPCGENIPLAEPPNPNGESLPPFVARVGEPLRVDVGKDNRGATMYVTMKLEHIQRDHHDGWRMEFRDQMSMLQDQMISKRDEMMTMREEIELEKKKIEEELEQRLVDRVLTREEYLSEQGWGPDVQVKGLRERLDESEQARKTKRPKNSNPAGSDRFA
jgi:hypothetical protein